MLKFKYKAISKDGQKVDGIIEAYDEFEAIGSLKQTHRVVESLIEIKPSQEISINFGSRSVPEKSLALLCSQFSIVLTAGMPLVRSIQLIADQIEDKKLKEILVQVADDVGAGYSLSQSFENKGGDKLPLTFIETIRAGEAAGTLDVAFRRLHSYYDKSAKTKSKIKAALAYPTFLMIVAAAVVAIIMLVAVPKFADAFASMSVELPLPTRMLIGFSDFASKYGAVIALFLAAGIMVYKIYGNTAAGGVKISKLKLRLPIFGRIAKMKAASQFAGTLSTMLAAGLPMTRSVAATAKAMDNVFMGTEVGRAVSDIEEGKRLAASLQKSEHLPEMLVEMTAVGEETGELEKTLSVVGEFYDSEVELSTQKALSMLEPAIIAVLAAVVVVILLSVYVPMFSLYQNI